jgi:hypothetical protein
MIQPDRLRGGGASVTAAKRTLPALTPTGCGEALSMLNECPCAEREGVEEHRADGQPAAKNLRATNAN